MPEQPTALIVDDEWGLFGWFQRLTHQGVPFVLLKSARKDFELFVEDCIELYRHGTRPASPDAVPLCQLAGAGAGQG